MSHDRPALGIFFICFGMVAITANDLLIKLLAGGYALHELVALRTLIGLIFTVGFLQVEGGFSKLRTGQLGLHMLRGLFLVCANITFFCGIVVMPLGQATAIFHIAPLMITLFSIPLLGERVGPRRLGAVIFGFVGVLIMFAPWSESQETPPVYLCLPILAATFYALNQVMTRRLGVKAPASVLAFYVQIAFLLVSVLMFLAFGDGRLEARFESEALKVLFRAWIVPPQSDWGALGLLGACAAMAGYCLAASYRLAPAATIAAYEYVGLPMAILGGWLMFDEWPNLATWVGCAMILAAGVYVFLREQERGLPITKPRRGQVRH